MLNIEYIASHQNLKSEFFLKKDHTEECYDLELCPLPNNKNNQIKKDI